MIYLITKGGNFASDTSNSDAQVENWVMFELPYFFISGASLVIFFEW